MLKMRVFDTRRREMYEPEQVVNIDYERNMITLKNAKGYKLCRFLREVNIMLGSSIKDCSTKEVEIFEGDQVMVDAVHPGEKVFYGVVKFVDGTFIIENEVLGDAMLLFQETRPVYVIGKVLMRGEK